MISVRGTDARAQIGGGDLGLVRARAAAASRPVPARRPAAGSAGTREPSPGSPQACSQPPCSRASSSAMARPRPVPPVVRARAGSARQNRLKTSCASPGRRPTPWSRTATATASLVRRPTRDLDRPALAVLDRVDDQVAQDPLDPAGVDLGDARGSPGSRNCDPAAAPLGQRLGVARPTRRDDVAQVDRLGVEGGGAGVEPADLEQVGEQRLEPVQLGLQQLGRPRPAPGRSPRGPRGGRRRPSGRSSAGCAARATRRRRTGAAPATGPPAGGSVAAGWRPSR